MNPTHENLARAEVSARLADARAFRQGRQLARVRRTNRRAEQLAARARLALARAL